MSGSQIIKLMSSDNAEISVGKCSALTAAVVNKASDRCPLTDIGTTEREVAERSILIKNMMEDIGDQTIGEAIPIPNVGRSHMLATSGYEANLVS